MLRRFHPLGFRRRMGSIPERSGFDLIGRQGHPAALPTPPPSRPQGPTGLLSRGPRWRRLRRQASEIALFAFHDLSAMPIDGPARGAD